MLFSSHLKAHFSPSFFSSMHFVPNLRTHHTGAHAHVHKYHQWYGMMMAQSKDNFIYVWIYFIVQVDLKLISFSQQWSFLMGLQHEGHSSLSLSLLIFFLRILFFFFVSSNIFSQNINKQFSPIQMDEYSLDR